MTIVELAAWIIVISFVIGVVTPACLWLVMALYDAAYEQFHIKPMRKRREPAVDMDGYGFIADEREGETFENDPLRADEPDAFVLVKQWAGASMFAYGRTDGTTGAFITVHRL